MQDAGRSKSIAMLNNIRNPRSSCLFDFQGQIRQKGDLFSPVFFPLGALEILRVSRACRIRKQATIKFDQ